MLSEEKIRLMTEIAMYEKSEEKQLSMTNRYFKADYIGIHMLRAFIYYNIGALVVIGVFAMYNAEILLAGDIFMDWIPLVVRSAMFYGGGLLLYLLVTHRLYAGKYEHSKRIMKLYIAKLKRLNRRYEFQTKTKELSKGDIRHDGSSGI